MIQMYPQLENYLSQFYQFQPEEMELIVPVFSYTELKRGEDFIKANKPVSRIGFILEGIVAACDYSDQNKCISYFVSENHFFSEAVGLYKNEPADLTLKAMTNCRLLEMETNQIELLDSQILNLKNIFLAISVVELTEIVRMQNLKCKGNSSAKLTNFKHQYPKLYSELKMRDIASYLNISPYTVSRIK